ncbi:ATP-binding domain-containing protein [Nocardioides carbamazepini]|nr:ATP-binding domain-containing protein [Nocardioides carbamazepini]
MKVGTFKRAKGLDFKCVLMPGLRHHPPPQRRNETDSAYAERLERFRRELFVGMTRARDRLWLGYLPR